MDPQPLTTADWAQVGTALKLLWLALVSAIIAGSSLLTAHAIIPSAVATRTISDRWERMRLPLYALGIMGVAGIGIFLFLASQQTDFLHDFYPRWWQ